MTTALDFARLLEAICAADSASALQLLSTSPTLAMERAKSDAYLGEIGHYQYGGDSALHIAAAAYQRPIVQELIDLGADVHAQNRRGARPLHYAADGAPGSRTWNPDAQVATIAQLIEAGADPNATDKSGVMPLHRAVRTRCAAAVKALLDGGADARAKNRSGSTPMDLAMRMSGRGGTGSAEPKAQQAEIVLLLERHDGSTR